MKHESHVLIPSVAGIGNALMTVPMVRQLKRGMPSSRITIAARTGAMAEVFQRLEAVDQVRVIGPGSVAMARAIFALRREDRPDIFLIPFPSNRWQYMMLALASGARRRILHAYPVGYFSALGCIKADRMPAMRGLHDVVQNLRLLEALGIEPELDETPEFALRTQDRHRAGEMLRSAGLDEHDRPLAIHPGSARTMLARAKRWPAESYSRLIASLSQEYGDRVIVLAGPDESAIGDEIARCASPRKVRVLSLTGPLAEAAAVLERCELYIGSDSGLAHLAAAVGTPPVTLFAPADPDRVCPFGYRHLVVQPPGRPCPCFMYPWDSSRPRMRCHDDFCIRQITVELVLDAVERAMARRRSDRSLKSNQMGAKSG